MPDRKHDYDIIILGGGSAGIVAGVMAGGLGMRVLLIEKGKMGGECLNTGCVPSKALLHAAKVAHTMRTAAQIGLPAATVSREDAAGALRHVRETIAAVREADATEQLLRDNGVEIRHGDARFLYGHTLEMNGYALTAANFILTTGSHPVVPDIAGLREAGFWTNQTVFDMEAVPESLLVIGGGPNGVEMAQAFARLGSRVTLVQKGDRLLPRDDSELTKELEGHLRGEGIDIRLNAPVLAVRREDGRRVATIRQGAGTSEVACDEVFVAVGRAPNVAGLNLEAAGVAYDAERVTTDANLRTTAPHIYACGDLLGEYQFSHMAEHEAKIVVRNIVFPGRSRETFRIDPWATFTDPELAHLGLTEDEARARGIAYEVYAQPFAQNDRALTDNVPQGRVKVLAQGLTGKILGVHILGPSAGELMQEWILAVQHGHSLRDIADMIHVYPTLSMACQHAAQRWYERQARQPAVEKALDAYVNAIRPRQAALAWGAAGTALVGVAVGLARRRGKP
ncbi:MAG: FAD-dependent oxidoreductase [Armatimonadetes bacterium]|nr:FAD-dependent oxidoreductase [Armatimonadota bacterium]